MAVGLELILTACLMFVLLTSDRAFSLITINQAIQDVLKTNPVDPASLARLQAQAQALSHKLATAGWVFLSMFLGLWSTSTIVRKWGWQSETELRPLAGIALPLGAGFLSLLVVMAGASR